MTRFVLLFLLVLPVASFAQPVADTLDWRGYFPLGVGNVWEYRFDAFWAMHLRMEVVGDSTVEGTTYFVLWSTDIHPNGERVRFIDLLRYDDDQRRVVKLGDTGNTPWLDVECAWDAPFGSSACLGVEGRYFDEGEALETGDVTITPSAVKTFGYYTAFTHFAHGYGNLGGQVEGGGEHRLTYVRVGDEEIGTPRMSAVPDTLDWRGYFPLEVGNVWEFGMVDRFGEPPVDQLRILSDSLVDGVSYFVLERTYYHGEAFEPKARTYRLLRYDEASQNVVVRGADGEEYPLECSFSSDFDVVSTCDLNDQVIGGYVDGSRTWGQVTADVPATKWFGPYLAFSAYLGTEYAHGIGPVMEHGSMAMALLYARVGDREYGTSVVPNEDATPIIDWTLTTAPNPFSEALRVHISGPLDEAARVEVFDVLGRRVYVDTLAPGTSGGARSVATDGWAAGVYVVRVTAEGGTVATERVMLVR